MTRNALAKARALAAKARKEKAWIHAPTPSLATVRPVNRPRRILRPIY